MASKSQYTKLYDCILEIPSITHTQKIILSKIISFESNGMTARMGNNYLGKILGLSPRQIRRHLQHLENAGLTKRIQTSKGRVIKVGPKCPPVGTITPTKGGHSRPKDEDMIDHLLDKVNNNS